MKSTIAIPFALAALGVAGTASAVTLNKKYETRAGDQLYYSDRMKTTDLINTGNITLQSSSSTGYTPLTANARQTNPQDGLADAIFGPATGNSLQSQVSDADGTFTATYNLNTTYSPQGYALSAIQSFASHADNRVAQNYKVELAFVGAPDTWVDYGTYTGGNAGGSNQASWMYLEDPVSPGTVAFATGVSSIRFNFSNAPGQVSAVWREIDVIGLPVAVAAPVPEPSSWAMMLAGAAVTGTLARRRARVSSAA